MGLLDRVKETAGGVVATAQDGLSKSQAKHQADEMFKVLGQAYFAYHCGRATLDEVDALAAGMRKRMDPIERQLGPVPFPQPLPEPPPPALLPGPAVVDVTDQAEAAEPTTAQAPTAAAGYAPTTAQGYDAPPPRQPTQHNQPAPAPQPTRPAPAPAWTPPPAPQPAATTRLDPSTAWQPPPAPPQPPAPDRTAHLDPHEGWPSPAGHHDGVTSAYPTAPRAARTDETGERTTAFDPTTGWPLPDPEEERTWFDAWPAADDSR